MCQEETSESLEGVFPSGVINHGKNLLKRFDSFVFFECYLLCALAVLVQAEIFDKHFLVLLTTSKTKMKGEQIPQSIKE